MKTKTRNGLLAAGALRARARCACAVERDAIRDHRYGRRIRVARERGRRPPRADAGRDGRVAVALGLRGTEDLGGGYQAVFTLESGFNVRGGDLARAVGCSGARRSSG